MKKDLRHACCSQSCNAVNRHSICICCNELNVTTSQYCCSMHVGDSGKLGKHIAVI